MVLSEQTKVFKYNKLIFILYGKEIIIKTPLQAFYLCSNGCWKQGYYNHKIRLIRDIIPTGEITTLNELAWHTRPGIKWASTLINYDTSNCVITEIIKPKVRASDFYDYGIDV